MSLMKYGEVNAWVALLDPHYNEYASGPGTDARTSDVALGFGVRVNTLLSQFNPTLNPFFRN